MTKNMRKINCWKWAIDKNLSFYIFMMFIQDINASSWCCWNSVHIDDPLEAMFESHIRQKYLKTNKNDSLKEIFLHNKENFKELQVFDDISSILDENPNDFWKVWHICFEFSKKEHTMLDEKIKIADLFFLMIETMHHQKMAYAPLEKYIFKIHELSKKSIYLQQEDKNKLDQHTQSLLTFRHIDKKK